MDTICYEIDAKDRLIFTDAAWFEFAAHNGFAQPNVVGTSLWQHLSGSVTSIYRNLLLGLRRTGRTVTVPFRCDEPESRRFMVLEMKREGESGVRFRSVTRKTESRDLMRLLLSSTPRSEGSLKICSWCKRIQVDGQWSEVESAVEQLDLLLARRLPRLNHTVCSRCESEFKELQVH